MRINESTELITNTIPTNAIAKCFNPSAGIPASWYGLPLKHKTRQYHLVRQPEHQTGLEYESPSDFEAEGNILN
jgi:hypothetical protein